MWFAKQTYRIFSLNRDGVRDWHSSSTNKHSKLDQSLSIPLKFLYFRYIFQIVFVSLHSQLPQILLEHFFFSDSRLECLPVWLETCSLTYILTICQLKRDSLLKKTPTIVRNGCPVRNSTQLPMIHQKLAGSIVIHLNFGPIYLAAVYLHSL